MKRNNIFIPTVKPEDWKLFLSEPSNQWKTGYSAKTLAYCWHNANGFPGGVKRVFKNSGIELFQDIELLLAFPEYKVPLPPMNAQPSQNDIFILARGNDQLVSVMVEGKVSESFGEIIEEWIRNETEGKRERLNYLINELELINLEISGIRYQLLHRTASAIIEAKRFTAKNALMLVHSFSQSLEGFDDYCNFLALFGLENSKPNSLLFAKNINGINLYLGWVTGEEKYLKV